MASSIQFKPLHPSFAAEVTGCDFSSPIPDQVFAEILKATAKYGVLVFRNTALDDLSHAAFARQFGELDSMKVAIRAGMKTRFDSDELADQSNMEYDGSIIDPASLRAHFNRGNNLFHVDNSYNARRASYSLLRAQEVNPGGTGGNTEFADTRQAYEDLPEEWKRELTEQDYVACHSIWHSRKVACPDFFERLNPDKYPMARHRLIQRHYPSGRMNMYIPSHCHHIEGLPDAESKAKLDYLYKHATQPKYTVSIPWKGQGDLFLWDNTCTLHRATLVYGEYRRDMRRATVLDDSANAWGLNTESSSLDASGWSAMLDVLRLYNAIPSDTNKATNASPEV